MAAGEESAAQSHRMLGALWNPAVSTDETRAYLQTRLTVYSRLMFWNFAGLVAFLATTYRVFPNLEPRNNNWIFGFAAIALAMMAFVWRVLLVRRRLSVRALHRIDLIYAIGIGTAFGASAYLSPDIPPAAWTSLIFTCLSVFTRALVVPSSGPRTTLISAMAFVPVAIAGVGLALTATPGVPGDLPPLALVGGDVVFSTFVVLLATTGSRVIYGLTRKVHEAMQLGQYTLEAKIGEGGMGVVYRAHHVLLRRPTAVKLLLPDLVGAANLDRFEQEVQHTSQLTHPNTVAIFDYGRSPDGVFYYAMEYLGGGIDLENLVRKYGPQPAGRVVHILAQVCGALQEAHTNDLIHRDIKPANIILCQRGGMPDVAKVVDFGLVTKIADTNEPSQVIHGSPGYVAPEAITDPGNIGPAVDLYALGAVGYFLLTGRRVFEGKTPHETCILHVTMTPKKPSEVSSIFILPELEAILMSCLEKLPADRPASAAALARSLRAVPERADWSEADAQQWWVDYLASSTSTSATTPTRTITVDLDRRT